MLSWWMWSSNASVGHLVMDKECSDVPTPVSKTPHFKHSFYLRVVRRQINLDDVGRKADLTLTRSCPYAWVWSESRVGPGSWPSASKIWLGCENSKTSWVASSIYGINYFLPKNSRNLVVGSRIVDIATYGLQYPWVGSRKMDPRLTLSEPAMVRSSVRSSGREPLWTPFPFSRCLMATTSNPLLRSWCWNEVRIDWTDLLQDLFSRFSLTWITVTLFTLMIYGSCPVVATLRYTFNEEGEQTNKTT